MRAFAAVTVTLAALALTPAAFGQVLSEGFEDVAALGSAGWFFSNQSAPLGVESWLQGDERLGVDAQAGALFSFIQSGFDAVGVQGTISDWFVTPEVSIENGTTVSFFAVTFNNVSFPDRLQVRLSVNGASVDTGTSATDVGDFQILLLDLNPNLVTGVDFPSAFNNETWARFSATVSGLSAPTTGRVGFRYFVDDGGFEGANSSTIGIDTLTIAAPAVAAPEPGALALVALGALGLIARRR